MILGSKLPIHNRCPSCREPSERMDAFSRGRVLVSASINPYEILKETEHSDRKGATLCEQEASNSIQQTFTQGGHVLGSPSKPSVIPQPGPQHQFPWDSSSSSQRAKAPILDERGVVLCAETSFFLLKPEADWAGGQSLCCDMIHQFNNCHPKYLETTRKSLNDT